MLVKLDDLFGYGRVTNGKQISEWWKQNRSVGGINSYQGREYSILRKFIG